jgi:hypothetical protein
MMMMMMMMICGLGLALATSMHAQLFRPSERSVKLCCPRIDRHEGQRMLESFNCPGLACLHWIRPRTRGRIPGCALTPRIPSCRLDKATIRPNLRFWPYPRPRRAEPACPKLEPLLPPPGTASGRLGPALIVVLCVAPLVAAGGALLSLDQPVTRRHNSRTKNAWVGGDVTYLVYSDPCAASLARMMVCRLVSYRFDKADTLAPAASCCWTAAR